MHNADQPSSPATESVQGASPWSPASSRRPGARLRTTVGATVLVMLVALGVGILVAFLTQPTDSPREVTLTSGDLGRERSGSVSSFATPAPGYSVATPKTSAAGSPQATSGVSSARSQSVFVHVVGAVRAPGIFQLPAGARGIDAVSAAGGLTEDADQRGVNLAQALRDGEQLVIPRTGDTTSAAAPAPATAPKAGTATGGTSGASAGGKVSLNRASATELDSLPRIGPALAQRIVEWRTTNGPFTSIDDVGDVSGIGDAILAGIRGLVEL